MSSTPKALLKPLFRGHSHQAAFFTSLGACALLIAKASTQNALLSATVYSFGLLFLFGVSALYHRPHWQPKQRALMKRLDHCGIFIFIAGTVTPICLMALSPTESKELLWIIWGVASLGVLQSIFWVGAPKWFTAIVYVGMGSIAVPYINALEHSLGRQSLMLILSGGLAYTIGAVCYATKWPKISPRVFGYHEVFHALTIVGVILHFVLIYRLIN